MTNEHENKKEKEREALRIKMEASFEDYRKSGLSLMATIMALSSGALATLWGNPVTQKWALLFILPITLALLQQLAHYLGSQQIAKSNRERLFQTYECDESSYMEAYIGQRICYMYAGLYFDISDCLSWVTCLGLGFAVAFPVSLLGTPIVLTTVTIPVVCIIAYAFWEWRKVKKEIANTDW